MFYPFTKWAIRNPMIRFDPSASDQGYKYILMLNMFCNPIGFPCQEATAWAVGKILLLRMVPSRCGWNVWSPSTWKERRIRSSRSVRATWNPPSKNSPNGAERQMVQQLRVLTTPPGVFSTHDEWLPSASPAPGTCTSVHTHAHPHIFLLKIKTGSSKSVPLLFG